MCIQMFIYIFKMYVSIQDLISLSLQSICIIATMSALCVYEQIILKREKRKLHNIYGIV